MSKIVKRNFVKKHMEKYNKPMTHADKKVYDRKTKFKQHVPRAAYFKNPEENDDHE